jgi:hypothetical protein
MIAGIRALRLRLPWCFNQMLWIIAVILCALWALGLATSYTADVYINLLLTAAIIAIVVWILKVRQPVKFGDNE